MYFRTIDPHVVHLIDPLVTDTVALALIGIVTTLITTAGVVIVAFINNKRERTSAADEGITATLRERIALRDEQIADLRADKSDLAARLDSALAENEEKTLLVRHLRAELAALKHRQEER